MTRTRVRKVPAGAQEKALQMVAVWMGARGYGVPSCADGRELLVNRWGTSTAHADDGSECERIAMGPAPTGLDAASSGSGPQLIPDWDWPSSGPTPSIILEGGPDEWAYRISGDEQVVEAMRKLNIFCEPYSSWALCLYRYDDAIGGA